MTNSLWLRRFKREVKEKGWRVVIAYDPLPMVYMAHFTGPIDFCVGIDPDEMDEITPAQYVAGCIWKANNLQLWQKPVQG